MLPRRPLLTLVPVLLLTLLAGSGCAPSGSLEAEAAKRRAELGTRPVRVVATTSLAADLARHVGGPRVEVVSLMGPGVDPHLYRAREGDIARIARADLILYHGLHLEAKLADVLERLGERKPAAALAEGIDPSRLLFPPESPGAPDPHIWFDVRLWMDAAERTRAALAEIDPEHAAVYDERGAAYAVELEALDTWVRAQAARLPAERRVLITAHDAFSYFGRAYGFEVRGLQGISTAAEAGTADLQRLAELVARRQIPAIFAESSVSPRSIQAVQAAVRARGFTVTLGGELFSDALGDPRTPEGTYVGMVRHNVETIVGGLLGRTHVQAGP